MHMHSCLLLGNNNGCLSVHTHNNCVIGILPNYKNIKNNLENSLMLITSLNTKIGYEKAAHIAKTAHEKGTSIKEESINLGYVTEIEFNKWVDPKKMC